MLNSQLTKSKNPCPGFFRHQRFRKHAKIKDFWCPENHWFSWYSWLFYHETRGM